MQYLIPFKKGRTYAYTAPVDIKTMSFLVPDGAGVTLQGEGLSKPGPFTLQDGTTYSVYSLTDIAAGRKVEVRFDGSPRTGASSAHAPQTPLLIAGGIVLGLVLIGLGVWWWRRPEEDEDETPATEEDSRLDAIIARIARLDEAHENGLIESGEHKRQREALMAQAKKLVS